MAAKRPARQRRKTSPRVKPSLKRPSWLWRWHHLLSGFILFFGIGMAIASLQLTPSRIPLGASASENLMGWIWADPIGWVSVNSDNPGACNPGPCGTYGVHLNPATREINGFAWSDAAGWICFGSSCAATQACNGIPPNGPLTAKVDSGFGTVEAHGWAKICNLGNDGWISLNCLEPGGCAAVHPYYRVVFNSSTGYFKDLAVPGTSFAWNGTVNGQGMGYMDFSNVRIVAEVTGPTCNDNLDNDLNGLKDCQEQACGQDPVCKESPANNTCQDGVDNDGNGKIDCAEQSCSLDPACGEQPGKNNPQNNLPMCKDGQDNDSDGKADCADSACGADPVCAEQAGGVDFNHTPLCKDGIDDDADGKIDCQDSGCQADPVCYESAGGTNFNGIPYCADGIDDDGDGQTDCADPECANDPVCLVSGEAAGCNNDPIACCSNNKDDDQNGQTDCADQQCLAIPVCTPAWLLAKFGNVYAGQGISAQLDAQGKPKSMGTYCLTSKGAITGFVSGSNCTEADSQSSLQLPKSATAYQGTLGSLDIPGILNGRYGQVMKNFGLLPSTLNGKIYLVNGDYALGSKTLLNGIGSAERGNGLLIVEGDLTITADISYQSNAFSQYLRNLASFGVIVKKRPDGTGGNIFIQPQVQHIVGAYFAEDTIFTGKTGGTDVPLHVLGLFAAHRLQFERNYRDPNTAAETILFDGRAVANPPPGMQEISKSLPTSKDAF